MYPNKYSILLNILFIGFKLFQSILLYSIYNFAIDFSLLKILFYSILLFCSTLLNILLHFAKAYCNLLYCIVSNYTFNTRCS